MTNTVNDTSLELNTSIDANIPVYDQLCCAMSLSNKKGPVNYVKNGPLYLKFFMSDERTLELPMTNIKITHF